MSWYKKVKNTQGNVEASSYWKLNNILEYGFFTIGKHVKSENGSADHIKMILSPDSVHACRDLASVIKLSLHDSNAKQELIKDRYTLGELNDLESQLVLITGGQSPNKLQVDLFLNVSKI